MRYRPPRGMQPYEQLVDQGFERRGDCLLSKASRHGSGYRYMQRNRVSLYAHRISFEKWHGPIPEGLFVDHSCHNEAAFRGECDGGFTCHHRACVNPGHLKAVTSQENIRNSPLSSRAWGWRRRITHCPRGHGYTAENTRMNAGSRICKACQREKMREARMLKRGC